jgi:hypothetical protein
MSSKLVRQARRLLIGGAIVSVGLGVLPVQAQQVSDTQVAALVEALRLAAPKGDNGHEGLTSDWAIKPSNIPRWSRLCTGQEMTPAAFSANPTKARQILACVMRDVMNDAYKASGGNESSAVVSASCWWMTGTSDGCKSGPTRDYAQKVLSFYNQQRGNTKSQPPATVPKQPASSQSAQPPASSSPSVSDARVGVPAKAQSSATPQQQTTPGPSTQSTTSQNPPASQSSKESTTVSSSSAQISDAQVSALVEALRVAAPQPDSPNDELYGDWQVKAENIPRWSKQCNGQELTPTQFQDSPVTARAILVCVMRDVLREQYAASSNNEPVAVKRAAAWWMTGNPDRYTDNSTATYAQRVLDLYQQSRLKFFSHI